MHRRRRPSSTVLSPVSRIDGGSRRAAAVPVLRSSGAVGAAYISSSSSSSSTSTSPSRGTIVVHSPVRTRAGQTAPEVRGSTRSSARRSLILNETTSRTSRSRIPLRRNTISSPKPLTRSQHRAIYRIPPPPPSLVGSTLNTQESAGSSSNELTTQRDIVVPQEDPQPHPPLVLSHFCSCIPGVSRCSFCQNRRHHPTRPLSRSVMTRLRTALQTVRAANENSQEDDDCVICLDTKYDRTIIVPCMHTFCFDCIHRWLVVNPSCPLCKQLVEQIIHTIISDTEYSSLPISALRARSHERHSLFGSMRFHVRRTPADVYRSISSVVSSTGIVQADSLRSLPADNDPLSNLIQFWNRSFFFQLHLFNFVIETALVTPGSPRLDPLLQRQLVYLFHLHAFPVTDDAQLRRDISPEFFANNEAQRHRLQAFVRRELRVLLPWMVYESSRPDRFNPAVVAPLLQGPPGLLTETPYLDAVAILVTHIIVANPGPISTALLNQFTSISCLSSLVLPTNYLRHFITEVRRFARFAGTLEQYDESVCLYSYISETIDEDLSSRGRPYPPPATACYVSPVCQPALTPGFTSPSLQFSYPLLNHLLTRMFVHNNGVISHPERLYRATEIPDAQPPTYESPAVVRPVNCHPYCTRLSHRGRRFLSTVISLGQFVQRASRRENTSPTSPTRNLFQRLLCELLDLSRFSDTLAIYFHRYCGAQLAHVPPLVDDELKPVLDAFAAAMIRLDCITQMLSYPSISSLAALHTIERWFDVCLHSPVMPLSTPMNTGTVVDLTDYRQSSNNTDWTFLRQTPWTALSNVVTQHVPGRFARWLPDGFSHSSESLARDDTVQQNSDWRQRLSSCVVISDSSSSSSSDDDVDVSGSEQRVPVQNSAPITGENADQQSDSNTNNAIKVAQEPVSTDVGTEIETAAQNLSLNAAGSAAAEDEPRDATTSQAPEDNVPEAMEVDDVLPSSRRKRTTSPDNHDEVVSPKLAKIDDIFARFLSKLYASYNTARKNLTHYVARDASASPRRRRQRHRHSHTRSPILLISSDSSDCEVIDEYIRVSSRSRSPTSRSSSSSTSSTSCYSGTHRSRSPVCRSSKHLSKHRHHHKCRRRVHLLHRHSCCTKSRHHRTKRDHRTAARHRIKSPSHCVPHLVNRPSSPIVISDDSDVGADSAAVNQSNPIQVEASPTPASCSYADSSIPSCSYSSTSRRPKMSIFEPASADDFYQFIERLVPSSASLTAATTSVKSSTNEPDISSGDSIVCLQPSTSADVEGTPRPESSQDHTTSVNIVLYS